MRKIDYIGAGVDTDADTNANSEADTCAAGAVGTFGTNADIDASIF